MLGTLLPIGIIGIALAVVLPLTIKCSEEVVITSKAEAEKYLEKHKKVHNYPTPYNCTKINDTTLLSWFWNRNNYGAQNIVNGWVSWLLQHFDFSEHLKIIIRTVKSNSCSLSWLNNKLFDGDDEYDSDLTYRWDSNSITETMYTKTQNGQTLDQSSGPIDKFEYISRHSANTWGLFVDIGEPYPLDLCYIYSLDYPNITLNL